MNDQPKRRRGRPTNAEIAARKAAAEGANEPDVGSDGETPRQAETKARRRRRDDSGETLNRKLFVPDRFLDRARYEYRWINDTASGRVQDKTVFDDWEIVTTEMLGPEYKQASAGKDMGDGTSIRRVVGAENNQALYAYFCRKPREFHEEDQLEKQKAIKETEDAMRHGHLSDPQGIGANEAYTPRDHRNIIAGR